MRGVRKPKKAKTIVPKAAMEKTYSGLDCWRTAMTQAERSQMATIAMEIHAYLMCLLYQISNKK